MMLLVLIFLRPPNLTRVVIVPENSEPISAGTVICTIFDEGHGENANAEKEVEGDMVFELEEDVHENESEGSKRKS